jgi:hypothetical protein
MRVSIVLLHRGPIKRLCPASLGNTIAWLTLSPSIQMNSCSLFFNILSSLPGPDTSLDSSSQNNKTDETGEYRLTSTVACSPGAQFSRSTDVGGDPLETYLKTDVSFYYIPSLQHFNPSGPLHTKGERRRWKLIVSQNTARFSNRKNSPANQIIVRFRALILRRLNHQTADLRSFRCFIPRLIRISRGLLKPLRSISILENQTNLPIWNAYVLLTTRITSQNRLPQARY